MGSKYRNEYVKVDGITFHSKREAEYYQGLKLARMAGDLHFFLRQVPFDLPGDPPVRYLCDFVEFWKNGETRFVDVKGFPTPTYKMKKKMVEALYPIKILET